MDPVQHMGFEEMDVELIESDDAGFDMGPSKMTLVECRESLKGITNFIAQDACLGDEDLIHSNNWHTSYWRCKQHVL